NMIELGEGQHFPIYRDWCIAAPGTTPTICPNADPPADDADRRALSQYLPEISQQFRDLHLIGEDQTIHWVGRQARLATVCHCDPAEGATDREPEPEVNPTGESTPSVQLRGQGEEPIVLGKTKSKLTKPQYNVVKALLDAGETGFTKDELVTKSGHEDA